MKDLYFLLIIAAAALDVGANLLLKKSDGFKHKKYGFPALLMVCVAFTLLAQVTQYMDLTVAYICWGALAIIGTVVASHSLFGQKLNALGYIGIAMILSSIILLKTA